MKKNIELSKEEMVIICNSLNEVCNIVEIPEFELRIGSSEERAIQLLKKMGDIFDSMDEGCPK